MAHHNSTPASVLNAPLPTFDFVSEQQYMNRRERRHSYVPSTRAGDCRGRQGTPKDIRIPLGKQPATRNTPYRKPVKAA